MSTPAKIRLTPLAAISLTLADAKHENFASPRLFEGIARLAQHLPVQRAVIHCIRSTKILLDALVKELIDGIQLAIDQYSARK